MAPAMAKAAVLGHPIGHSKSPLLHRAAYRRLGAEIGYSAVDLTEEMLPDFMREVRESRGWRGLSVTMPLKHAMVAHLDELEPLAETLGFINTVEFGGTITQPRLRGHNTDVAGIVNAVRHAGVTDNPAIAILGGGGTAASAVAASRDLQAGSVRVFVRSQPRADNVLELGERLRIACEPRPWAEAPAGLAESDLVISTLPSRGADGVADEVAALRASRHGAVLLDAAYDPWPSRLASVWAGAGGTVVHGLEMLLYQAVEQVGIFTGRSWAKDPELHRDVINVMCEAVGLPRR